MHRSRPILPALTALVLLLTACADGTASSEAPSAAASEAPPASIAASEPAEPSDVAEPSVAAEPSEEAVDDEFVVTLSGFAFSTGELTVPAGTEVTFENVDSAAHTVTEGIDGRPAGDPIINAQLGPGGTTAFTFEEPGEYEITCLFHPNMNMTVVVEG